MRIDSLYGRGRPVFSFEFFPPKTDEGAEGLMRTAADLKASVHPDFISVTYGAGGSTRDRTHEIVSRIRRDLGLDAMAHQTCVGDTPQEIREHVERLIASDVRNILALRGDKPQDSTGDPTSAGGFQHATDLIEFLKDNFELSIGAACYPEAHPESPDADEDLRWTTTRD